MSIADSEILNAQIQVGKNVRRIRLSKGLSQSQLSALCDIEKTAISRIERGKTNVTIKTLLILSRAFNAKISELVIME